MVLEGRCPTLEEESLGKTHSPQRDFTLSALMLGLCSLVPHQRVHRVTNGRAKGIRPTYWLG